MTTFVFANNVNTTLAGSIGSGATSLTLASSANLPASIPDGEYFVLTLNDAATQSVYEIVYATAITGSTVTVVRGQEGTSAQAWLAGDFIFNGPTAGQMASFGPGSGGVTSFNTRTGAVTLAGSDVNAALGYTAANDSLVVHKAGTESITGSKTFTTNVTIATSGSTGSLTITDTGASGANIKLTGDGATTPNKYIRASGGRLQFMSSSYGIIGTIDDPGNMTIPGKLTAATSNFTSSDRRLKRNIRKVDPRPLHRHTKFVSYTLKDSGWNGLGSIAQNVQLHAPEYVGNFEKGGKSYLSLNYTGMAFEQALWAGQEIDRVSLRLGKLERALKHAKIEPRKRGFCRRVLEAIW